MSSTVTLRPVSDPDRPFLFELFASTREAEMQLVPWTGEQKQAFLEMQFAAQLQSYAATHPRAAHDVICMNGKNAGRLYLNRSAEGFHILDITVAPNLRNGGIGSEVLREILKEADQRAAPVSIYVETFNPSVRLFERLGFQSASVNGFQVLMRRPPVASA
jgi:ribosomal protein S18 acetylase RimI-like enzyme